MSVMIDRTAKALCGAQGIVPNENEMARAREEVQVVLIAMREPSKAMMEAGAEELFGSVEEDWNEDAKRIWQAMIDTALAEPKAT